MSSETREEVVCLVDGEHEYNHTITEEHSVEVVGYAESGVHDGAGGTTQFVVGQCTDVLLKNDLRGNESHGMSNSTSLAASRAQPVRARPG